MLILTNVFGILSIDAIKSKTDTSAIKILEFIKQKAKQKNLKIRLNQYNDDKITSLTLYNGYNIVSVNFMFMDTLIIEFIGKKSQKLIGGM